ncbi:MAG: EpsI family protein [Nitrospirae bacterium]|nr:EpsI family protein [Nitrospirota bacterium]
MGKSQAKYFVVIGMLLATALLSQGLFRSRPTSYKVKLDQFPLTIGSWKGKDIKLGQRKLVYAVLETKTILSRLYVNSKAKDEVVDFLVIYSERTSRGFHPPEVSFVAAGNTIVKSGIEYIPLSKEKNAPQLETNMFLGKTPRGRVLFLYWFSVGDRLMANYYKSSLYLLWDTIKGKDSPTTMVRLAMPLVDDDLEKTMAVATSFIQQIIPILPEYTNRVSQKNTLGSEGQVQKGIKE